MSEVLQLNEQEKIFLAGAIKVLILADGSVDEQELDDLDRLVEGLGFDDYEEHLKRFEATVKSDTDFEYLAHNIFHKPTKQLITRILWDLALQHGFASPAEEKVIRSIQQWWKE
ncbi:MAG: TerB family tellurite resistance protein [Spirochaetales bacterium]